MNRRLYFILPNLVKAKQVVNELLLQRVGIDKIHALAQEGVDLDDLPEASVFQRTDVRHSLLIGLLVGIPMGVILGLVVHDALSLPLGGLMVVTTIIGMLFGGWCASMIGLMTENADIRRFRKRLRDNHIILMVDVEKSRVAEIETFVTRLHPEAIDRGVEPTLPSFP